MADFEKSPEQLEEEIDWMCDLVRGNCYQTRIQLTSVVRGLKEFAEKNPDFEKTCLSLEKRINAVQDSLFNEVESKVRVDFKQAADNL